MKKAVRNLVFDGFFCAEQEKNLLHKVVMTVGTGWKLHQRPF